MDRDDAGRRAGRLWRTLLVAVIALMGLVGPALGPAAAVPTADGDDNGSSVTLLLFHGEGCPHCAAERAWLAQLAKEHPQLQIEAHEVWNDAANRALLDQYAQRLGFEPTGVPVTIVGDRVWIGFSDTVASQVEAAVVAALAAAAGSATPAPSGSPTSTPGDGADPAVELPLVGRVALAGTPLLVSTLLIGFADGVNPCSLWVLAILLAVVLHSGSRGRVALVGGTFLLVTAGMYGLYIAGMYSALDYAGEMAWIRVAVSAVALAFGILQLKDGLAPGTGPSLSIAPERRPGLYRAMREVARPGQRLGATLAGTAVLAVGVSLLETPCTAGLPLMWTSMLAEQQVALGTAVALFAAYMAVFLLDELVIFGAAVVTMRARRLQPEEGRVLKIVSGSLLVTLAVVMVLAPQAMAGLGSSLAVFALAAALGLVVWWVARSLQPHPAPSSAHRPRHHR